MNIHIRPKACVVGGGFIGPVHVEALRRVGIEVRGVAGKDEAEAKAVAAALRLPRAYAGLDEALADLEVGVVHLAVPNRFHAPYARMALLAGKHVVCEKPLAMSSAESAELVQLAAERGLVAATCYNLRFYPLVREARERLRSGSSGRPYLIQGSYLQDWLLNDDDWNWRLDPEVGGPLRAVADIGTHWLDMLQYVVGRRVIEVMADFSTVHPLRRKPSGAVKTFSAAGSEAATESVRMETEDCAVMLLRFEGGAKGALSVSQVSAGRKNSLCFEVDAANESLAWDSEEPNTLRVGRRGSPSQVLTKDPSVLRPEAAALCAYPAGHQEGYADTFARLFERFYDYVAAGDMAAERDFPGFDDGHREMLLCDALLKSSREGRWVRVDYA